MKTSFILGAVTVAGLTAGAAFAGTLDDVKARGKLNCGVSTGVPGFAEPDANGVWQGFDVAVCRAVAAAVLSDSDAIHRDLKVREQLRISVPTFCHFKLCSLHNSDGCI